MTRRRQRNNGNKKTRSMRGGALTSLLKNSVKSDCFILLSQYFRNQPLNQGLIIKYASNIELKEFADIYTEYINSSDILTELDKTNTLITTFDYFKALEKYGGIRNTELDVITFASGVNVTTTAVGVGLMGASVAFQAKTISMLSETIGKDGLAIPIDELSDETTKKMEQIAVVSSVVGSANASLKGATAAPLSTLPYASAVLGLGTAGLAAISATGLGLVVLFALVSATVYISNLYLKEKELQELSRLIVGVCEYIKKDAHVIHMFYTKTGTSMPVGAKLTSLLKQLYNLLFKTLSYFPEKIFYDAYKSYLEVESVLKRVNELNTLYKTVYNTKDQYSKCGDIDVLLETGNFLLYRYIFIRLCIINKDKYLNVNEPSQKGGNENFRNDLLGKSRYGFGTYVTNVGSSIASGVKSFGNAIAKNESFNAVGTGIANLGSLIASPITSPITYVYSKYRVYFRPIAEVVKSYNESIKTPVSGKFFAEQLMSNSANTSFLGSAEQFRQLLGDYAIMDTTYTMSVTKYVFDFNTYLIQNMGNSDNLKKAIPTGIPDINFMNLEKQVSKMDDESQLAKYKEDFKKGVSKNYLPLIVEIVYKDIFGKQQQQQIMKNMMSFDRNDEDDKEPNPMPKTDSSTPSTSGSSTPRSSSEILNSQIMKTPSTSASSSPRSASEIDTTNKP